MLLGLLPFPLPEWSIVHPFLLPKANAAARAENPAATWTTIPPAKSIAPKAYSHPLWEEMAKLCFSCGSCNLVCPTCYCFDVREEVNWDLSSGQRFRLWDGCMLADFATIAGNLNFRKDRADRYRHRYYRKGKYVPAKIGGKIACVGCGRCITACVAKIANPVEVFNRLAEEK